MPRVLIVLETDDPEKYLTCIHSNRERYRSLTTSPIYISTANKGEIALCLDVEDLASFYEKMRSQEMVEDMAISGVKRGTARITVFEHQFNLGDS